MNAPIHAAAAERPVTRATTTAARVQREGYPMSWTHIEDKHVRARKPHECWLCCEPIEVGAVYCRRAGISEDGPLTMHMHPECEAETRDWDWMDWETFSQGDMDRPSAVSAG